MFYFDSLANDFHRRTLISKFTSKKRHCANTCVSHAIIGNEPKSHDLQCISNEKLESNNIIITVSFDIFNRNMIALRGAKESHLVMLHEFSNYTLNGAHCCVAAVNVELWRMASNYPVPILMESS